MRIDGLGSPGLPLAPISGGAAAGSAAPFNAAASAAALAIQQEEQKGGGGGGHGHGVKKTALDSIDEIAARASVTIEQRKKTVLDRMADIEKMKAELANAEDDGEPGDDDLTRERKDGAQPDQSMTA